MLRTLRLGETSKIVSVLTSEYGRIKVVAKGARQLRSRWASLLEPGNEVRVLVYVRPGRDLWMLSDVQLLRGVLTAGHRLDKLSLLFAAIELCERILPEQEPAEECEAVLRSFLEDWHEVGDGAGLLSFFRFEMDLASALGIAIDVENCGECGRRLAERAQHRASDGYLRCHRCVTSEARWIEGEALARLSGKSNDVLDAGGRRQLGRLLHEHLGFHLANYRLPQSLFWVSDEANE